MRKRILLFILFGVSFGNVIAQQRVGATAKSLSSTNTSSGKFYYVDHNEPARAIEFKEKTVTASHFLANINRYFGLPTDFTFVEAESNIDNLGMHHRLMQQYYKGVLVEGMGYRVHEKDGFVTAANGKAVRNVKLDPQTILSQEQAFRRAVQYLQTRDTTFRNGRKLIVSKNFTFTPESFAVAFQFDIDVSLIEQWRISIDARTGELINKVSLVNSCFKDKEPPPAYGTGNGLTNYYGNQTIKVETFDGGSSRLKGQTESGGIVQTYDFQNVSVISLILFFEYSKAYDFYSSNTTYNSSYLKPAVSAHWAAEQAYEYYFKKHNRNSFDNKGSTIKCYVHVDQKMDNAFWTRNLLAFGDGSNDNPLVELDVVSHELTHGVTQYEAGLQYFNEPGALNESFSDIFGKVVEFYTFGDTASWQLAKHFREGGLRNMSNPNLKNQPDTYHGDLWYTGYEDNGGVHYNSGVQNFWFYLLCQGGSGVNDHELSYSINAIGMEAAANIAYRNLTEYLGNYSDYLDSRIGSLLATADLYGKNSVAYQEVDKAWDAVGVLDEPIITSLELYDITATTVKIKGSLLPRGDTVTYHFEYGTTPDLGSSSPTYNYTNTVTGSLSGLQSQTKYYIRLVATNENGSTSYNSEFTTISLAPLVKIKETVDVTETTAIFYGEINPNSLSTSFYFEYGPTPALGLVTSTYPLNDKTEFLDVSAPVANLLRRQTYYYRLVATNGFASSTTESVSFFTAVRPVVTAFTPATAPIGAAVTITGQNFNPISKKNLVTFGAARGEVLSSSGTEIKIKVPEGASFGPISVSDIESGLTSKSVHEFVPTFTGGFNSGDLQLRVGISDIYIWQALVEDIDGDHKPDIIGRHPRGFSVLQNVNQGGDITDESFIRNTIPAEYSLGEISLVDFDGNGLKDVVGRYQNEIRIYPNLSVPGFVFFGVPVDIPNEDLGYLAFEDFDLDGHIDIAGINYYGNGSKLTILRNQNPKGSLTANNFEQKYGKALSYYVYFLTTGDVNNDGASDILLGTHYEDFLSILKNNSQPGAFAFQEIIVKDSTRGRFVRYISHDLNQDGRNDVIAHAPYVAGNLAIMEGKDISFETPVIALTEEAQSIVRAGDINGDGKVDLVAGLENRKFIFLENNVVAGGRLTSSSLEKFAEYGMPLVNSGSGTVDVDMMINDLNGDGRPEVINAYSYNFGPHDGYQMEIWQNAPAQCPDPTLITLDVSSNTATIILPPDTNLDQFEIEYRDVGNSYWYGVSSTTLYISRGYVYQLRARAKCYLGFTDYHYIDFTTECVDTNSLSVTSIGVDYVYLSASNLSSFEIQYTIAGSEQWETVPQYSDRINDLLPGTTYDLRFRGRCNTDTPFKYKQYTTLCPKLSTLRIDNVIYNKAVVSWTSNYAGDAILEYSVDNIEWLSIDDTGTIFPLLPGKKYFVRGSFACTDVNSDFNYTSFTTPCPEASRLTAEDVTPFSATMSWEDESETGRYILTYSLASGGPITTLETNATSFDMDGLSPGTQYKVSVAPYCNATKNFSTTIFSTICYSPFDLSASAVTHTSAELSWNDNFAGMPYFVDYSISGSKVWLTTETDEMLLSLTDLRPGTEYEVRVHIHCPGDAIPYASLRFETDLYEETTFAPNPTENKVTIYPSKNLIGNHFIILDNTGRRVVEGDLLDYSIDLTNFLAGVYTLKIEGEPPMRIVKH
jgi:Zn-dependent metalloprotease